MSEKREIVSELVERGIWERTACEAVGISRSAYRYKGCGDERSSELKDRIVGLAGEHKRYGYRRITAILRRDGERVNHKKVWRIWREAGLVPPRRRRRSRKAGRRVELPTRAEYRGRVWTYDFVYDRTQSNRVLKMLVVLDEYTRECHRIRVEYRLNSLWGDRHAVRVVRSVHRAQAPEERQRRGVHRG